MKIFFATAALLLVAVLGSEETKTQDHEGMKTTLDNLNQEVTTLCAEIRELKNTIKQDTGARHSGLRQGNYVKSDYYWGGECIESISREDMLKFMMDDKNSNDKVKDPFYVFLSKEDEEKICKEGNKLQHPDINFDEMVSNGQCVPGVTIDGQVIFSRKISWEGFCPKVE